MGIVTISRGSFSHGKEIAEKVAIELGYEAISREILLEARSTSISPSCSRNEVSMMLFPYWNVSNTAGSGILPTLDGNCLVTFERTTLSTMGLPAISSYGDRTECS